MSIKKVSGFVGVVALMFGGLAIGQTQVPNTFSSGQPARASEVNENFDTLEAAVDQNAADIDGNTVGVTNNANDIQSLNASLAALGSGGAGLSVLFINPVSTSNGCDFAHLPSGRRFFWASGRDRIDAADLQGTGSFYILENILTIEDSRVVLLDLIIRIGNLPLVVEDFRDPATGEFDCTNEKLLSLL